MVARSNAAHSAAITRIAARGRAQVTARTATPTASTATPTTPPPSQPPTTAAPVVVSGPTAVATVYTQEQITVSFDQPCQLYIEYGLTAGYGSEGAHETSFNYSTHVQVLTGLTTGTEYHYRLRATNAAGQTYTGPDQTFTTDGTRLPDVVSGISLVAIPATPASGGTGNWVSQPTFSDCEYRKLHLTRYFQTRGRPDSLDGTSIIMYGPQGTDGFWVMDAVTLATRVQLQSGVDSPRWSNVYDHRIYGTSILASTIRWHPGTSGGSWTVIRDFAGDGYALVSYGQYEQTGPAVNDRVALLCKTTSLLASGRWDLLIYDPVNNLIVGKLQVATSSNDDTNGGGTAEPQACFISQSGDYAVLIGHADGSGHNAGTRLYQPDGAGGLSFVRTLSTGTDHQDTGFNAAGADISVIAGGMYYNGSNYSGGAGKVTKMSDGTTVPLVAAANMDERLSWGHVGGSGQDNEGWAVLSTSYKDDTKKGNGQLVAFRTDGSGECMIYGHEFNTAGNEPVARPSRDMDTIYFNSVMVDGVRRGYAARRKRA